MLVLVCAVLLMKILQWSGLSSEYLKNRHDCVLVSVCTMFCHFVVIDGLFKIVFASQIAQSILIVCGCGCVYV